MFFETSDILNFGYSGIMNFRARLLNLLKETRFFLNTLNTVSLCHGSILFIHARYIDVIMVRKTNKINVIALDELFIIFKALSSSTFLHNLFIQLQRFS